MNTFSIGMLVECRFGQGRITAMHQNHATVEIKRGRLGKVSRLRVALKDLTPLEDAYQLEANVEKLQQTFSGADENRSRPVLEKSEELKALHSLRFGLVPHERLPELTCGFPAIKQMVQRYLPRGIKERPVILEICGSYGTGKSHTMSVVRWIAKEAGYITARVEVDGKNVSLSDPKTLLSNLWQTLEGKNLHTDLPLLELYLKAMENNYSGHRFQPQEFGLENRDLCRIHDNFFTIELLKKKGLLEKYAVSYDAILSCHDEIAPNKLQGQICREPEIDRYYDDPRVKPMIGRRVAERPYDFIESLFGHGHICYAADYKGLVVTIDEFEVEYLGKSKWERVEDLLEALIEYFQGKPLAPVLLCFATIKEADENGDNLIDQLVEESGGECYELEEMDWEDVKEIGKRIQDLYYKSYNVPSSVPPPDLDVIWERYAAKESGKVRSFIKHYLAALDDCFGPPNGSCDG